MSAANATANAIKGQTFRAYDRIVSSANGNPITGGLTSLTATMSLDGAAFSSTGVTVNEIGTSGYFYVEVAAAQVVGAFMIIRVTASNSNAAERPIFVPVYDLSPVTGRWDGQSVLRIEQLIFELHCLVGGNGVDQTGAQLVYRNPDGTAHVSSVVTQSQLTGSKSKPS